MIYTIKGGKGMKRKIIAILVATSMLMGLIVGCSTTSQETTEVTTETEVEAESSENSGGGTYAMVNKIKVDYLLKNYRGFEEYSEEHSVIPEEKSPSEVSVSAQVQILDELVTQGVDGIAINANGDTGYDEVIAKAVAAGIDIVSFDAAIDPSLRTVHVNQASTEDIGAYMLRLGVLAALKIEYSGDNMEAAIEEALADYDGEEIVIGCLTAGVDAPVQNAWLEAMETELEKDVYQGKVSSEMDIKYGNDDLTESTTQAQAYLAEDKVDTIVCISTVALAAACQVYQESSSDVKVTGCGAPSEIQGFMPAEDEDTFDAVCPYIVLWDLGRVGAVASCALLAIEDGTFDGSLGSTLTMDAWDQYPETTFEVTEASDGGTEIVIGEPMLFDKTNVADWVDVL